MLRKMVSLLPVESLVAISCDELCRAKSAGILVVYCFSSGNVFFNLSFSLISSKDEIPNPHFFFDNDMTSLRQAEGGRPSQMRTCE